MPPIRDAFGAFRVLDERLPEIAIADHEDREMENAAAVIRHSFGFRKNIVPAIMRDGYAATQF